MKLILARLGRIILAYITAAFASGACVLGGASMLSFIQNTMNGGGEITPISHSIMALVFIGVLLTVLGLLPAIAMGLVAEFLKLRHWSYYVMSGCMICFVMWRGLPFQATGDFQFFLLAGALGGGVYWRIAGQHAGSWTSEPVAEAEVQDTSNGYLEDESSRRPQNPYTD